MIKHKVTKDFAKPLTRTAFAVIRENPDARGDYARYVDITSVGDYADSVASKAFGDAKHCASRPVHSLVQVKITVVADVTL